MCHEVEALELCFELRGYSCEGFKDIVNRDIASVY